MLSDNNIADNLLAELDNMDNKAIGLQALYTTFDCAEDQTELHEKCTFIKLLHYVCSIWIFIPLMHNAARFLKCV